MRPLMTLLLFLTSTVNAADLFVATDGDDKAPGTKAHPLHTLEAARDRLRTMGAVKKGSTVWLRGGRHIRTETLDLTAADSGTTWRAVAGEEVRISAGIAVPGAAMKSVTDPAILERLRAVTSSKLTRPRWGSNTLPGSRMCSRTEADWWNFTAMDAG